MARATINPGNCGFTTSVEATPNGGYNVKLEIHSDCKHIQRVAARLPEVDAFQEISRRGDGPQALSVGHAECKHTSCPVPVGIIKVVEVAAGLALPTDVTITFDE